MELTNAIKKRIMQKIFNGVTILYVIVGILLLLNVFSPVSRGIVKMTMSIIGIAMIVFVCLKPVRFALDVWNDQAEVMIAEVIEMDYRAVGKKRSFLTFKLENGETKRKHVIPRIFQETEIGDCWYRVSNRFTVMYVPAKDID